MWEGHSLKQYKALLFRDFDELLSFICVSRERLFEQDVFATLQRLLRPFLGSLQISIRPPPLTGLTVVHPVRQADIHRFDLLIIEKRIVRPV